MRRSKINWAEILGLLPSSLILAPLIAYGALAMFLVMGQWATDASQPAKARVMATGLTASVLLLMAAALAGLAGVWAAVLVGAERLRENARQRWSVVCCLLLGIAAAGYWLVWMGTQRQRGTGFGATGWGTWIFLLGPPLLVGAHQIYLLVMPASRTATTAHTPQN